MRGWEWGKVAWERGVGSGVILHISGYRFFSLLTISEFLMLKVS